MCYPTHWRTYEIDVMLIRNHNFSVQRVNILLVSHCSSLELTFFYEPFCQLAKNNTTFHVNNNCVNSYKIGHTRLKPCTDLKVTRETMGHVQRHVAVTKKLVWYTLRGRAAGTCSRDKITTFTHTWNDMSLSLSWYFCTCTTPIWEIFCPC